MRAIALLTMLAACGGEGATQVVLVVADPESSFDEDELSQVSVTIRDPGGAEMPSEAFLGPGNPRLPRSLLLVHEGGRLGPFLARVTARGAMGGAVLTTEARFSFVAGSTRKLFIEIDKSCQGNTTCTGEQTCTSNGCEPIDRDTLPEWDGRRAALISVDAGP